MPMIRVVKIFSQKTLPRKIIEYSGQKYQNFSQNTTGAALENGTIVKCSMYIASASLRPKMYHPQC